MTRLTLSPLCALLVCVALHQPARAESIGSAASSAASAASSTAGSLSDSVQGSSKSSAGEAKVADGAYRVWAVAPADKPGHLLLTLRPVEGQAGAAAMQGETAADVRLRVPEAALAPRGIQAGEQVQVRNRSYGLEFARLADGQTPAPFFLALNEVTLRELRSHALSL